MTGPASAPPGGPRKPGTLQGTGEDMGKTLARRAPPASLGCRWLLSTHQSGVQHLPRTRRVLFPVRWSRHASRGLVSCAATAGRCVGHDPVRKAMEKVMGVRPFQVRDAGGQADELGSGVLGIHSCSGGSSKGVGRTRLLVDELGGFRVAAQRARRRSPWVVAGRPCRLMAMDSPQREVSLACRWAG